MKLTNRVGNSMKAVIVYSGGLDSTTLLYQLRDSGAQVLCLGIDYGQRHKRELECGAEVCSRLGVEYQVADLSSLNAFLAGNALTDSTLDVPDGHYTDQSMRVTVVPNRNMLMISVAVSWAVQQKFDAVAYAAHSGDHTIYPDCRPEFIKSLGEAIKLCDWHEVELLTPFAVKDKTEIVRLGADLGVPFALTWSCYKGGQKHCGTCGTCVERKEAFSTAGIVDPTSYLA